MNKSSLLYTYQVVYSKKDRCFIASVLEFPSIKCNGGSMLLALQEIILVVENVITDMKKSKEIIPEPTGYKG